MVLSLSYRVLDCGSNTHLFYSCLVFITASEYFAKRFAGTDYGETFQNYFSTYSNTANLVTFIITFWLQNKTSFKINTIYPIILNTITFGVLAATVETQFEGANYFYFIMFLVVTTGVTTSFFQNAVFSEAGQLPPVYTQAVLSGQGIAGVIVAISSILSVLAGNDTQIPDEASISRSAFMYFLSALVITLVALIGRITVVNLPFYRKQISNTSDYDVEQPVLKDEAPMKLITALRKVFGLNFGVAYIFIVTLMVYPSITSLIKSVNRDSTSATHRFYDDDIFVAFHFLLFNIGDWVGRVMPLSSYFQIVKVKSLIFLSASRTLFIPLFLVCNVIISSPRSMPTLINNDLVYFLIVFLFSVSSGWICSLCMMAAPQLKSIESKAEQSMVGGLMSFSLVLGLAIGGSMSFILRAIV
ncbi:nucleoside transporter-domain-containing protein [Pilobolus umbonatus]|nr:nucleoside transporter-domain-containing protein [Pilobolus umbonatus]